MNKIFRNTLLALFLTGGLVLLLSTSSWVKNESQSILNKEAKNFADRAGISTPVNRTTNAVANQEKLTTYAFESETFNFGEVKQGKPAKHTFWFTNTGTEDLVVENVKPSCSCTASNYSKNPVAPGEKGYIELEYSAKKLGVFRKSATITANTDPRNRVLNISGEVIE